MRSRLRFASRIILTFGLGGLIAGVSALASSPAVVVSIPEQRLYLFAEDGSKVASYRVSTSAHGLGDKRGTYSTPLGKLVIASKIGANAEVGAVFKAGRKTGEICKINAPGRDPVVTRILHLRGMEPQNSAAYDRRIYIHGTPDERHIGKPVSFGCVRMRSSDVIELFDQVSAGTTVEIVDQRVGKGIFAKTTWPVEAVKQVAQTEVGKTTTTTAVSSTSKPKIAMATKSEASKPSPKAEAGISGPVGLLNIPGMEFKFGSPSTREIR